MGNPWLECGARLRASTGFESNYGNFLKSTNLSRRSLSAQEVLMGPEPALKYQFRDSNRDADDICVKKKKKEKSSQPRML